MCSTDAGPRLGVAALIAVAALAALPGASSPAAEFAVHPGKGVQVVFSSKAAMEQFEGKTNRMSGSISIDPAALGDTATVRFEVDMASLDTGIKMRNTHMRENHLETSKHPRAIFEGVALPGRSARALQAGRAESIDVEGTFTLHGVSRRIRLVVEVVYRPEPSPARIEFKTTFPVAMADYSISRPQFLFLKLADVQTVRVSGVAVESAKGATE